MWEIEFQTPVERIYTKTALFKQKIVVRVSNSSGGNLHIISTALGRDLIAFQTPTEKFTLATCATYIAANPMFQTPAEEIYTLV